MIRPPATEMWRAGFVPAPIATLVEPAAWPAWTSRIAWLPDPGPWRYLADPFGLQRAGRTHVFVEAFDYRTLHGVIEHHELAADLTWRNRSTVLALPHHVSYPFVVEHEGEVFMLPENYRSNALTLYRAHRFPGGWVPEATLLDGIPVAEPSLLRHEGRWWLFFTIVAGGRDARELHVAHAEHLTGPWRLHPQNPVLNDASGGRPGGTPFLAEDRTVWIPVQDCRRTYGGALRFAQFETLSPDRIVVRHAPATLTGDLASRTHLHGFHTLASCGNGTLFDVKCFHYRWSRHWVDFRRRVEKRLRRVA